MLSSRALWPLACLGITLCCAPAEPPATGGADRLLVLTDRDTEGLDPHTSGDLFQTDQILANIYEGLVWRTADLGIEPALALSWSNPDDRTWDFVLRRGVRFHDGRELAADDVVYSIDRARQQGSALRTSLSTITSVEAAGRYRVRLRTREADAALVSRLWNAWIVSRQAVVDHGEAWLMEHSAGTGPYRVSAREPGLRVELSTTGSHWRVPPAFARATFLGRSYGPSDSRTGVPVIFWLQPGTPQFEAARRQAQVLLRPGLSVAYLSFDLESTALAELRAAVPGNPFTDPRVRRAIALAIDYRRLSDDAFDGQASIPTQPIPPAVAGFDESLPAPRHDPQAARQLLEQTPWRAGFEIPFDVRELMSRYADPVVRDLAAIGIRATPRVQSDAEFFARVDARRASFAISRFSCRTGDAQEYLDKWVRSRDAVARRGESNFSYRTNPVPGLDQAIDAARTEFQPIPRLRLLKQAMRQVVEADRVVPLLIEHSVTLASPELSLTPRVDALRLAWDVSPQATQR